MSERPRRSARAALLLLGAAQFVVTLDASVVNVALPDMRDALALSATDLGWVLGAYALAFGGFQLVGGRAADVAGRRRTFMVGLAIVGAASACGAASASPLQLVAARAAQGLGAALLLPAALAAIASLIEAERERTRVLGMMGGLGAAGTALGVVLGGLLTEALSWRWTFLVNVPTALAGLVCAPLLLARDGPLRRGPSLDVAGAVLGTSGLMLLLAGLDRVGAAPPASWRGAGALSGAALLLAAFVVVERRASRPVLPLALLRRRSIAGANVVALVATGTYMPTMLLISVHLQATLGFSPLQAGIAFLPMTAATLLCAAYAARRLIARFGLRRVGAGALSTLGLGIGWLACAAGQGSYLAGILPGLLLVGAGASTLFPVVFSVATERVGPADHGAAAATVSSARQLGAAVGAAAMVNVAAAQGGAAAFALALGAVACGVVVAFATLPTRR